MESDLMLSKDIFDFSSRHPSDWNFKKSIDSRKGLESGKSLF